MLSAQLCNCLLWTWKQNLSASCNCLPRRYYKPLIWSWGDNCCIFWLSNVPDCEDQLIESMALEGITNFFAAGDSGSYSTDLESFIPATSPGSTPVGGGQLVAADSSGNPFPNTGV